MDLIRPNRSGQGPAEHEPGIQVPTYVKWSLVACLAGTFFLRVASAVMGSTLQLYFGYIDERVYPLSDTMRGVALALFFLPELIGSPVLGAWSDRFGRKWFIVLGAVFGGVGVQLTAMTTNFAAIILMRLLGGLSTASAIPATLSYLTAMTTHSESTRGRVMGFFQIATVGGTILGVLVGGRLWDGFKSGAFTIDAAIYLVSVIVFIFGMREVAREATAARSDRSWLAHSRQALGESLKHYRSVFASPTVLRFAPAFIAITMIMGIWLNHIVSQLVSPRDAFLNQLLFGLLSDDHRAGSEISIYGTMVLGVFGLGVLAWSLVLGRFRRTSIMLVNAGALFVLCGVIYAINHSPSLSSPHIPRYVIVALFSLFVLSGMMPAALMYLADVTESRQEDRGAIMGVYTILFGLGGFLGTLIGGPFADWRAIDGILFATLLLGAISTILILRLRQTEVTQPGQARDILSKAT